MSRIHTQMSVLGDTKCPRVQTLFVIGVTITLVTSCWMRVFSLFPICFSQQLDAINPALLLPPSYKEGRACGHSPKKLPLFTENPSRVLLGNRASDIRASRKLKVWKGLVRLTVGAQVCYPRMVRCRLVKRMQQPALGRGQ